MQGDRLSCRHQEGRRGSDEVETEPSEELDMTEVTKHACKLTGNILTRLPINESRKEEINTSPLE